MGRNLTVPPSIKPGIPKLGVKPKDWREVTFGDILEVVVRPAEVKPDQRYQLINAKRNRGGIVPRTSLLGDQIKTSTQFYVAANDFVISRRQIVHGACGIVPPELDGALVSNEYSTLVPKDGLLLPYLGYYAHTIHFQQTCFNSSVGVAIEKMVFNLGHWLRHRLYLPPIEYQREVVDILSTTDRTIARMEKLIAAKRRLKKGLARQLLTGQRRLPGFNGTWNRHPLTQVAWVVMGTSPPSSAYNFDGNGLPLIQGNADTRLRRTAPRTWTSIVTKSCKVGDILMSVRAPVGEISVSDHNACIGRGMCAIRARPQASHEYLYQALLLLESQWSRLSQGSTFTAVNGNDVRGVHIECPPTLDEQNHIAAILRAADREIVLLEKKLAALRELKKGLMQRLLSGMGYSSMKGEPS